MAGRTPGADFPLFPERTPKILKKRLFYILLRQLPRPTGEKKVSPSMIVAGYYGLGPQPITLRGPKLLIQMRQGNRVAGAKSLRI